MTVRIICPHCAKLEGGRRTRHSSRPPSRQRGCSAQRAALRGEPEGKPAARERPSSVSRSVWKRRKRLVELLFVTAISPMAPAPHQEREPRDETRERRRQASGTVIFPPLRRVGEPRPSCSSGPDEYAASPCRRPCQSGAARRTWQKHCGFLFVAERGCQGLPFKQIFASRNTDEREPLQTPRPRRSLPYIIFEGRLRRWNAREPRRSRDLSFHVVQTSRGRKAPTSAPNHWGSTARVFGAFRARRQR